MHDFILLYFIVRLSVTLSGAADGLAGSADNDMDGRSSPRGNLPRGGRIGARGRGSGPMMRGRSVSHLLT